MNVKEKVYSDKQLDLCHTPVRTYMGKKGSWTNILLKDETTQITGAFKYRGVRNFFLERQIAGGVVTASTGNHGLAVATCAQRFNLPVCVYVPTRTNPLKVERLKSVGAQLIYVEGDFEECAEKAQQFAALHDFTFIHSFEEIEIITGHESMFNEIDEEQHDFSTVYVPVGGGGLLTACLNHYTNRNVKVVGVEFEGAPALTHSLMKGELLTLKSINGKAEGLLVKQIGTKAFNKASLCNVETILVTEKEMENAIRLLWHHNQIRAEHAGAAALAAALKSTQQSETAMAVISGGNLTLNSDAL